MNDFDVIDRLKSAVGAVPEPPPHRMDGIRARARQARQRRWTEAIGAAAVVVAVTGGIVALDGGPAALTSDRQVDLLATAADKAVDAGTVRFEVRGTGGHADLTILTTGEADLVRKALRMELVGTGQILLVDGRSYTRIPELMRGFLGEGIEGKEWFSSTLPAGAGGGMFTSPAQTFDLLREVAGDPERRGSEEVRGVDTTAYRFRPRNGAATYVTVNIDEDGLPRRITVEVPDGPETALTGDFRIEFFDYGAPIEPITAPPASKVVDEDDLGRMKADALCRSASPPPGVDCD